MSLRAVDFEGLNLTHEAGDLRLQVTSTGNLRVPPGRLSSLDQEDLVQMLTSGEVWISRGRSCRLEIEIYLDGKPLENGSRLHVLESLGYHIRDALLWSQLDLSTSLELPPQDIKPSKYPHLIININRGLPVEMSTKDPREWLTGNNDVEPPDSALCARFVRLHVQMDFKTIQRKATMANKKARVPSPHISDPLHNGLEGQLTRPETITDSLAQDVSHEGIWSQINSTQIAQELSDADMLLSQGQQTIFEENEELSGDDMLLSQLSSTPSLTTQSTITFSNSSTSLISINAPQPPLSKIVSKPSRKRPRASPKTSTTLTPKIVNKLATFALRKIITGELILKELREQGIYRRQSSKQPNTPAPPLSTLVPSLFSPSFRPSVSQNAKFVSSISHSILKMSRNVVGAGLKSKLALLAKAQVCEYEDPRPEGMDDDGVMNTKRLADVVQGRMWSMMQRTLFDANAARKLRFEPVGETLASVGLGSEEYNDEDLLLNIRDQSFTKDETLKGHEALANGLVPGIANFMGEDEESLFEDLLDGDESDEDLLAYMEELERQQIEAQTGEMLFGSGEEGEDEDEILLDNEDRQDMLL